METSHLLKARRKCPIQISWKGNEQCFHKHIDSVQNALGKGHVSWERNSKQLSTQFDLKIVPFSEDLIWQHEEVSYCESVAFVHLFFVYVSTVEEYKNQVRYNIVDWYAQLNKAQNSHWLIIFDSTKAREKKSRGSVLEKLKSDFAKFQEKLVEICDGNMAEVPQKMVETFTSSLDRFWGNYEKSYAQMKGNWEEDDWNLTVFVNQQFNLCRFFWNLGLYDAVRLELDKIDTLISEIIANSGDNTPKWLQRMRDQSFGATCPLMRLLTHVEGAPEDVSLIELRTFLLANQVLSLIFLYNSSRRKPTTSLSPKKDNLANEYGNKLLKSVSCTIQSLRMEVSELNVNHDPVMFYLWVSLVLTDVMELTEELFVPLKDLVQEQNVLCQLISLKCSSLFEVYKCSMSSKKAVGTWLKATVAQRNADILGTKTAELLNVLRRTFLDRKELEGSPDQGKTIEELLDAVLIDGIEVLRLYQWEKASCGLVKYRFDVYKSMGDSKMTKQLYFELLDALFDTCKMVDLLLYYCRMGIELFSKDIAEDRSMMVNILLLLTLKSQVSGERKKYGEMLLAESLKKKDLLKKYNFDFGIPAAFPFSITKVSGSFIFSLVNEPVVINMSLVNNFDFAVPGCKIKAIFTKLTKTSTEPLNPLFTCPLNDPENSRCLVKAKGLAIRKDYRELMQELVDKIEPDSPVFAVENVVDLVPGTNQLKFTMTAADIGAFALNHVEIAAGDSLTFVLSYQQCIADLPNLENVHLMVDLRLPSVELEMKPDTLLAGIAQQISLNVKAGTNAIQKDTRLKVTYKGEPKVMEFQDIESNWKDEIFIPVSPLKPHEDAIVDVTLVLPIDEMHFSAEKSVLTTRQLQVEWLDQRWLIELEFLPLMTMKMSTTIIEERVLFSLDVSRSDSFDFLDLQLKGAELEQKQSLTKPAVAAKLINPTLGVVEAHSAHRIVWELPPSNIDKSIPLKHSLSLKYEPKEGRGKKSDPRKCKIPECAFSRDYQFAWDQELAIGKAEYYICAQIVPSEHASSCRLNQECSLVVSLKQLSNHADNRIVVTVDTDACYWSVPTKCIVVQMKESGIGHTDFSIIPKQVGFLPCPSVYIHRCNPDYNDKDPVVEAKVLGERLTSYHRLQGKQMWVIPNKIGAEDALSQSASTTGSLRTAVKRAFKSVASKMDREKE